MTIDNDRAKALSNLLDLRGIPHLTYHIPGVRPLESNVSHIRYWITDEVGGVVEGEITGDSLLVDQAWIELPLV